MKYPQTEKTTAPIESGQIAVTATKTYEGDLLKVAGYTKHRNLGMLQVYNDTIKKQTNLPRYYNAFKGVSF